VQGRVEEMGSNYLMGMGVYFGLMKKLELYRSDIYTIL
jgi:hypothetical protein